MRQDYYKRFDIQLKECSDSGNLIELPESNRFFCKKYNTLCSSKVCIDERTVAPDGWYENIEEPLKEIVYILRNNGVNTTNSCGHNLEIECSYYVDGEIKQIYELIYNYLAENGYKVTFDIDVIVSVDKGIPHASLEIRLPTLKKLKDKDKKIDYDTIKLLNEIDIKL